MWLCAHKLFCKLVYLSVQFSILSLCLPVFPFSSLFPPYFWFSGARFVYLSFHLPLSPHLTHPISLTSLNQSLIIWVDAFSQKSTKTSAHLYICVHWLDGSGKPEHEHNQTTICATSIISTINMRPVKRFWLNLLTTVSCTQSIECSMLKTIYMIYILAILGVRVAVCLC